MAFTFFTVLNKKIDAVVMLFLHQENGFLFIFRFKLSRKLKALSDETHHHALSYQSGMKIIEI